jgi:hypothetical protein
MDEARAAPAPQGPSSTATVTVPSIDLPKGGGAIRGIGEKFAANPVTGTGSMTVPIALSPGRSDFGPQLALSYDSGAGNGPFGFGWSLSLPAMTRKTDKGLPQYQDAAESDVFVLSGAEDLVPVLGPDGTRYRDDQTAPGYTIQRYRPRIEGLFARIERWTDTDGDVHWRSISKDNILTLYGKDCNSRIYDPNDPTRIFTWLICESRDDKGNAVLYEYQEEDGAGVDLSKPQERNRGDRDDPRRQTNRYLSHIRYGNRLPLLDSAGSRPRFLADLPPEQLRDAAWMFEAVLDYREQGAPVPTPTGLGDWTYRTDPFSSYRAGFEVRTTRLCHRVLMFHHFPDEEEVGNDCLVRSTDFRYSRPQAPTDRPAPITDPAPIYTFLESVTQTGYRRDVAGYASRSLPPVQFEYTQPVVQDRVETVDPVSLKNLPIGVDGVAYRWTDLHGEGIPGILAEHEGAWLYKRNLSPKNQGTDTPSVEFAPVERVGTRPNLALAGGQADFMDLAGDGQPDLVVLDGPNPGLYEHDDAEGWQPFRPFPARLNRDFRDPNLKLIDLDGDGHADVLITEDEAFVWHASLAEAGFGPARRVQQSLNEEQGPRLVFADGTQSIYLADLSGDGLTDLVRIRNGEVCYWPNLGYGRFGARVTMDRSPRFDSQDQFDQKRIRLADIDGSGITDLIYLHRDGVRLYFNQSGNAWSEPRVLSVAPRVNDLVNIVPTDLLGNGTACLVWSSPLPGDATRPMRYVNLMGEQKPHLLVRTVNNLGAETRVEYAPSTKFYLQDKAAGRPWITRLPFPVHVVERVETYDHISRNRFVTRYAYHHGYFDGEEREFRGFGMVEQWDTEEITALSKSAVFPLGDNIGAASHVPPVYTKTWFHTGIDLGRDHVSDFYAGLLDPTDHGEYFREPGLTDAQASTLLLPDTLLPPGLTLDEEREACRSLKGAMLRQEVYAQDGSAKEPYPYTVTEQNFTIGALQHRAGNRHAVFFTHPKEVIAYHYERNPADPRTQHALTLEVDAYGNVLKKAEIGYGRRSDDASLPTDEDRAQQRLVHITCTENTMTNALVQDPDGYRTPLPAGTCTYELRQPQQEKSGNGLTRLHRFDEVLGYVQQAGDGLHDIAYEDLDFDRAKQAAAADPSAGNRYFRRPIEHVRTLYRRDDLTALLPLGQLESLALPGEVYKLAFTPGLLDQVFKRPLTNRTLEPLLPNPATVLGGQAGDRGGYLQSQAIKADGRFPASDPDDHWWIPSGRSFFTDNPATELDQARGHFFLPRRYCNPFGYSTTVRFDGNDLLMVETSDAIGNRVTVEVNDYRILQPRRVRDPNGNRTEVAFDSLGLVAGTAVMGKSAPAPVEGDTLAGFASDLTQAQIDQFTAAPRQPSADPKESEATQVCHDLLQGATTRIIYDLDRFKRIGEPPFAATLARETHVSDLPPGQETKLQISFSYSDGFGREIQKKIQAEPGRLDVHDPQAPIVNPRWVGSGWTVYNNKGKPVRQYEPFFSTTHDFEFGLQVGVSPVLFYDPAERVIATLHPNHSYEKVVFDPWQQTTWDVNDTVRRTAAGALPFDPSDDPDVGPYLKRLPGHEYLPTWYDLRTDAAKALLEWPDVDAQGKPLPENAARRANERNAAEKAAAHTDTPTTAHFDALGRPFLTVTRNRVVCKDHPLTGKPDEDFRTRVELDIEGNQREVRDERKLPDAKGLPLGAVEQRIVMRYDYDMLGNRIHQHSMEAGARWTLNDVTGKPIRAWDSRGHAFRTEYDPLRRPLRSFVTGADPAQPNEPLLNRTAGLRRAAPASRTAQPARQALSPSRSGGCRGHRVQRLQGQRPARLASSHQREPVPCCCRLAHRGCRPYGIADRSLDINRP